MPRDLRGKPSEDEATPKNRDRDRCRNRYRKKPSHDHDYDYDYEKTDIQLMVFSAKNKH